jgi:hypothetical protein
MTASTPPSIRPREFVGLTQASTYWSTMDPLWISTSGVSANAACHACTTFALMSASTTLSGGFTCSTVMAYSGCEQRCSSGHGS